MFLKPAVHSTPFGRSPFATLYLEARPLGLELGQGAGPVWGVVNLPLGPAHPKLAPRLVVSGQGVSGSYSKP